MRLFLLLVGSAEELQQVEEDLDDVDVELDDGLDVIVRTQLESPATHDHFRVERQVERKSHHTYACVVTSRL